MKLLLNRTDFLDNCTIGKLSIQGTDTTFFTLERKRGLSIPPGTYAVVINYSGRFARMMPQILNVPGFTGIRIHPGNTDADTEGCVLVGTDWPGGDFITQSKVAFEKLFSLMEHDTGGMEIEIS